MYSEKIQSVQSLMYFSKKYLIKFGKKHKSLLLGILSPKNVGAICTNKGYELKLSTFTLYFEI